MGQWGLNQTIGELSRYQKLSVFVGLQLPGSQYFVLEAMGIDVFAYRSSKALVAVCILSLQFLAVNELLSVASAFSIAIFLGWIAVAFFLLRKALPIKANSS